jgi:hypothetical protein
LLEATSRWWTGKALVNGDRPGRKAICRHLGAACAGGSKRCGCATGSPAAGGVPAPGAESCAPRPTGSRWRPLSPPPIPRAPQAAARAARASESAKRATCARPRCARGIRPLCSTSSTNPASPPAPTPTSASAVTATAAKRSLGKEPARLAAPKVKLDRVTAPGTPASFRQLERLTAFHPTEAPRQARHRPATVGRPAHCLGAKMNAAPSG